MCPIAPSYSVHDVLASCNWPPLTLSLKGPLWEKYISKFSMTGGEIIKPAGQNGSREKRGRLCELENCYEVL